MNDTAKKLREAANYMADSGANSAHAIATVRGLFDVVESDTFSEDLGAVLDVIADELDELQARAAEANCLRQQLESAEKKAERRKKHIGYLNTALHDKNILLKQRGEAIARVTAENADLRKQVPSERERHILDMWPRFEDGEPVMIGDGFMGCGGVNDVVELLDFEDDNVRLWGESGCDIDLGLKPVVKRPVQSVLDADGVEIHVGDTVWHCNGIASGVVTSIDAGSLMNTTRYVDESGTEFRDAARNLTHIAPDSWERLAEDAAKHPCVYAEGVKGGKFSKCSECPWGNECDGSRAGEMMARDVIRRAKALAGTEVE